MPINVHVIYITLYYPPPLGWEEKGIDNWARRKEGEGEDQYNITFDFYGLDHTRY